MVPGRVDIAEHIVQISAGDSHTAFLSDEGQVFACGTFRVCYLNVNTCLLPASGENKHYLTKLWKCWHNHQPLQFVYAQLYSSMLNYKLAFVSDNIILKCCLGKWIVMFLLYTFGKRYVVILHVNYIWAK